MCLSLSTIYLYLNPRAPAVNVQIQASTAPPLKRLKAYILTGDCQSLRFNATRENIDRVFPFLFDVRCYLTIPLNDSRIHTGPTLIMKKFSSNLLAFVELWTYVIPEQSSKDPYEWSFIFEDDVNFINPTRVSLLSYTNALQQLMNDPEIQRKDGFIYLGICGPTFFNTTRTIVTNMQADANETLVSQKGPGFCLHASGITAKRARLFWTEISSYRPNLDLSLDKQLNDYSIRSNTYFYTFGSNFLYPPGTGHYGIAYQDRGRFTTTVA